ncbi:MAG: triose-phosphate isomerase [Candidatus Doudnabacteria bacterium]|nr:triose-phosphate isomerase [Candidatus Doudnabacteria bacterium]
MKKLIIGNWKLNPVSLKEAVKLTSLIEKTKKNTVVLCPPHVFLSSVKYPNLGAQDCFWEEKGAFTGQVSPLQLKNFKIKYVLVGHSERRFAGDDDHMVNAKIRLALANNIVPVLCVGYKTTVLQDDMEVTDIIKNQLDLGLAGLEAEKVVVAYEPVWAIGSGKTATPDHTEKIALFIKNRYGVEKVLYGGSVNPSNAQGFLAQRNVDGLLVGGASLVPSYFNKIINL